LFGGLPLVFVPLSNALRSSGVGAAKPTERFYTISLRRPHPLQRHERFAVKLRAAVRGRPSVNGLQLPSRAASCLSAIDPFRNAPGLVTLKKSEQQDWILLQEGHLPMFGAEKPLRHEYVQELEQGSEEILSTKDPQRFRLPNSICG
jgi:hypothetical protein